MSLESIVGDFFEENFQEEDIKSIMVGGIISWDKVADHATLMRAAVHCCMNGPVGVKKLTNFPSVDRQLTISSLYSENLSNKMWRNFCRLIAEILEEKQPELVATSQQVDQHGQLWPLNVE
jgi:hypothetical protein